MSLPIAPRPPTGGTDSNPPPHSPLQKARKISTACGACKQRKTKCSGENPCEACAARNSVCDYDATSDQRRKIANQRNVQELAHAQLQLDRYRQLMGGVIAIFRVGTTITTNELVSMIRNGADISSLAAHVRNELRSNPVLQQSFQTIDFAIDGPADLPSPSQLLAQMDVYSSAPDSESSGAASGMNHDSSNSGFSGFNHDSSSGR